MTKAFCTDCVCLVEGDKGQWICDVTEKEISDMDYCPEIEAKCRNCIYLGERNDMTYCNCGDSPEYDSSVTDNDSCECFEYE